MFNGSSNVGGYFGRCDQAFFMVGLVRQKSGGLDISCGLNKVVLIMTYPRGGSEYGGYPGLVQPEPHDVNSSAHEQLLLAQLTEAADASDGVEQAADRIRRQARIDRTKQNG